MIRDAETIGTRIDDDRVPVGAIGVGVVMVGAVIAGSVAEAVGCI